MVEVRFAADGRPAGEPKLRDAPFGPEQYKVVAHVLDALRGCGPLRMTPEMTRHAWVWRDRLYRFDTRPNPRGGP